SSARVMTTASMLGQAAGVAATWAADGRPVGTVSTKALRDELTKRGAVLEPTPGMTPVAPPPMGTAVDSDPRGTRH
ncbi:MAG TPA: hypothetical protein VMW65_18020, partial [Chloroflexota bacterium]|nr:hypothetical protein [Chloroflexota bacterium]